VSVTVGHLYPEHLNIYADRGNIAVLRRRCEWRGIEFAVAECGPGDPTPKADLYYLGGGQDRDQVLIADDLLARTADLRTAVGDGAGVLAVCGGYQLLGHGYRGHQGDEMPGTGLVDLTTVAGPTRMIGNITLRCELDPGDQRTLVGFENHAGRTTLGPGVQPLGRVVRGNGNNGDDGGEGVHHGMIIGNHDLDHRAARSGRTATTFPPSAVGPASQAPPTSAALVLMEARPSPGDQGAVELPLSVMIISRVPSTVLSCTEARLASECRTTLVNASPAIR